ncbi:GvpL/GvpF family gas vesicle protein [Streptomyces sp. NPDC001595]|uniref:GvpL/GvpF family gas vesicle protein n=1 Tax=Streptomyces sp. NPDC001532 TaxID=3154520 RepID=UPI00331C2A36
MALYVYAITKASHPLDLDGMQGIGEVSEVRPVREGSLCAVVSEAPEQLSMKREALQAHYDVQERLYADGVILPLGFGFLAPDEDAVRTVIGESAEQFAQRLDELTDRVEFNVKGIQDEEALLRQIATESEPVRRLNEATRGGGGTYEERLELGQLLAEEVQARQAALAETVAVALRPHAAAERLSEPSQQYFISASYLVDKDRGEEFTKAAEELTEGWTEGTELRVRGPLPPYSFA